jgi:hypothetical protein
MICFHRQKGVSERGVFFIPELFLLLAAKAQFAVIFEIKL